MLKGVMAALISATLFAAVPLSSATAQSAKQEETAKPAAKKKSSKKKATAEKKVTPQQQKMKDCAAKWGEEKKAKSVSGRTAYRKFMSGCLKA
ncbi:MAG: PsiF family protein [Pseudolabrys sp.]